MSKATAFTAYEWTGRKDDYVLTDDLVWRIGGPDSPWPLVVPAGFVFQSSVPKWLTWLVSRRHEAWLLAAAVHDRLLADGRDPFFAASEWARAARVMADSDTRRRLVTPTFLAMCWWTTRKRSR